MGLTKADLFNLTVREVPNGRIQQFRNITIKDSPRRIDKVLKAESELVRWDGNWPPAQLPNITSGDDDLTLAETQLEAANRAVPKGPAHY